MNNLELSNPVAWTDADELADMDCNTYGNIFNAKYVDIHNRRWLPLYSQGYVDFLIAQLAAAQLELIKPLPIGELVQRLEGQTYEKWFSESDVKDLRERAEKAEAELSAANERLSKPVSIWKLNNFREAPAGGIEWAEGYVVANNRAVKAIRDAGFMVEGNADAE